MVGNSPDLFTRNDTELSPDIQHLETPEGELYLRFLISSELEFVLPAEGIREVMLQSPDRITPIPNASPLLLGTINLRGQVIWVADLAQFLGEPVMLNTERAELPIIAIEDQDTILGLAIEEIGDMAWLDVEKLEISNNLADHLAPFVVGEWPEKQFRLLDHVAILRSARWGT